MLLPDVCGSARFAGTASLPLSRPGIVFGWGGLDLARISPTATILLLLLFVRCCWCSAACVLLPLFGCFHTAGVVAHCLCFSALDHESPLSFNFDCAPPRTKTKSCGGQTCECSCFAALRCCSCCCRRSRRCCCCCYCYLFAALLLLLLLLAACSCCAQNLPTSTFRPPPPPQVKLSHLMCLKLVAEFPLRSIGIDTQQADVNQSNPHCVRTSVPLVFALFRSVFLRQTWFGYQLSIGVSSGGDWGMTSWKQRSHGDLALK